MKYILLVGHSKQSEGAKYGNMTEYIYNTKLAEQTSCHLSLKKKSGIIITKDYSTQEQINKVVNNLNAHCVIELHANAYNEKVSGVETLYINSEKLASTLQKNMFNALGTKDRGIKKLNRLSRGYKNLKGFTIPCVITEPFFIDNKDEVMNAIKKIDALALAICDSCIEFSLTSLKKKV